MLKTHTIQRIILIAFLCAYALLSLDAITVFMPSSKYGSDMDRKYEDIKAPPYCYRVLVKAITREALAVMPGSIVQNVTPKLIVFRDSDFGRQWLVPDGAAMPDPLSDARIFDLFFNMLAVYITIIAFIWMLYVLAADMFPDSIAHRLLAPALALMAIIPFERMWAYSYDFSELFFSCALFYLLHKRRMVSYLACLVLATLNKETTIFMIAFYFIWFHGKLPRRQYLTIGALQVLLYLAIEMAIFYFYSPSVYIDDYLKRSGVSWSTGGWIPYGISVLTDGVLNVLNGDMHIEARRLHFLVAHDYNSFINAVVMAIFVAYRWMEKPAYLRAGGWIVLMNAIAFFLFCNAGEYRDFYFSLPILVLLAVHTLVSASGVAHLPVFRPIKKA